MDGEASRCLPLVPIWLHSIRQDLLNTPYLAILGAGLINCGIGHQVRRSKAGTSSSRKGEDTALSPMHPQLSSTSPSTMTAFQRPLTMPTRHLELGLLSHQNLWPRVLASLTPPCTPSPRRVSHPMPHLTMIHPLPNHRPLLDAQLTLPFWGLARPCQIQLFFLPPFQTLRFHATTGRR